jgi:hypothetical protein
MKSVFLSNFVVLKFASGKILGGKFNKTKFLLELANKIKLFLKPDVEKVIEGHEKPAHTNKG